MSTNDYPHTPSVITHALQGPWLAVLADRHGFVYDSVADAREDAEDPDEEFTITVVRGSALPNDRSGARLRLPGSHHSGDKAYELDDVYLDDPDDPSVGADARLAQAQAIASGLNAAAEGRLLPASGKTITQWGVLNPRSSFAWTVRRTRKEVEQETATLPDDGDYIARRTVTIWGTGHDEMKLVGAWERVDTGVGDSDAPSTVQEDADV